jgi:hypothetical protein
MEQYSNQIENALLTAKNFWKDNDWEIIYDKNDIKSEKKLFDDICPFYCYRMSGIINKSNEKVVEDTIDMFSENTTKFKKDKYRCKEHENGDNWWIMTTTEKLPFPMSPREALILKVKKCEENTIRLISISIDNEKYPCNESVVKMKLHFDVISFEKVGKGDKTMFSRMIMVDPSGSLPIWFVNLFDIDYYNTIKMLRKS